MPVRLLVLFGAVALIASAPATALADAADLAAAEEREASARADVVSVEAEVEAAERALKPVREKARAASESAEKAEAEAAEIEEELAAERIGAREEIQRAEAEYEDEQSAHDTTTAIGIAIIVLVVLLATGAVSFSRVRRWPLSPRLTQALTGALALMLAVGLAVVLVPSAPSEPDFSLRTEELAAEAEGDPADPPSPELRRAEAAVVPLVEKARPLNRAREKAEAGVRTAEADMDDAERSLQNAKKEVRLAARVVQREEREAAEEASFREEATAIDYDQLVKNPFRYVGDKVVYTGQIFQIQEGFGSFMLLSVTDEGYGFWTDEIWVAGFGEIESAEEDIITVYGTVSGAEEYETQIGGSNFVPKIKAKYIDE